MTSSLSESARTHACALNNMAIAMMVRGEFAAAVATLDDSLSIMFRHKQESNSPMLQEFAHQRVKAASSLLSSFVFPRSFMAYLRISTVESNDMQSLKKEFLAQEATSLLAFSAILIRDATSHSQQRIDFDRESGIILYNYGLACYLLTALTQKNQLKCDSVRSLLMSHTTFSNILFELDDATEDLESVFLAMLVLSSSSKIFRSRNDVDKAEEADEAAITLLTAVEEEMTRFHMEENLVSAAAA